MSNIYLAVTSVIVLLLFNVIGEIIVAEFEDNHVTNPNHETFITGLNSSGIGQSDSDAGFNIKKLGNLLLGILFWNANFNIYINLILWILRFIFVLSIADMIWVG